MISRRFLLSGTAGTAAVALLGREAVAQGQAGAAISAPALSSSDLRGSIDAGLHGVTANGGAASERALARLLADAASRNMPVFLPPGDYPLSGLTLPDGTRLLGIAGATRLVQAGSGPVLQADAARRIVLSGLSMAGIGRGSAAETPALSNFRGVTDLTIEACEMERAGGSALHLEACGGRIERNRISGAAEYGVYAVNSIGLSLRDNTVFDCGNGGILVHRWETGRDGTIVSGNRISRIGATRGGTGQYGNAINLFRAGDVIVSGNHISDAAFSAIRANSASNAMMTDNHCTGSGETAIYAEFAFEGALISGNVVDGAANGISVVNFNEGGRLAVVSGNIVRNLRAAGPYRMDGAIFGVGISVEADTSVTGNVVETAPYCGLALGYGPYLRNVTASGNIVRDANVGCAVSVVEGSGPAIIAGNIFQATPGGAIVGYRWAQAATSDLAKGGAERFSHLTVEGNRVS